MSIKKVASNQPDFFEFSKENFNEAQNEIKKYPKEKKASQINNKRILSSFNYLKDKDLRKIILSQKQATEKVFLKRNIPFRSFEIINKDEKTLGELFCFFILETILLGRALRINPYDQPSVELIKKETKKILL